MMLPANRTPNKSRIARKSLKKASLCLMVCAQFFVQNSCAPTPAYGLSDPRIYRSQTSQNNSAICYVLGQPGSFSIDLSEIFSVGQVPWLQGVYLPKQQSETTLPNPWNYAAKRKSDWNQSGNADSQIPGPFLDLDVQDPFIQPKGGYDRLLAYVPNPSTSKLPDNSYTSGRSQTSNSIQTGTNVQENSSSDDSSKKSEAGRTPAKHRPSALLDLVQEAIGTEDLNSWIQAQKESSKDPSSLHVPQEEIQDKQEADQSRPDKNFNDNFGSSDSSSFSDSAHSSNSSESSSLFSPENFSDYTDSSLSIADSGASVFTLDSGEQIVLQPGEVLEITEIFYDAPAKHENNSADSQDAVLILEENDIPAYSAKKPALTTGPGFSAQETTASNKQNQSSGLSHEKTGQANYSFSSGSADHSSASSYSASGSAGSSTFSSSTSSSSASFSSSSTSVPSSSTPVNSQTDFSYGPDEPDLSKVDYGFHEPMTESFLEQLQDGKTELVYDGSVEAARDSLDELIHVYCCAGARITYFSRAKEDGTRYLQITEDCAQWVLKAVEDGDEAWQQYLCTIREICQAVKNLPGVKQRIEAINEWVCTKYFYQITNNGISEFVRTKVGQCWHFAKLFADVCQASGIEAILHSTLTHSWVEVHYQGKAYRFDPAFNATCGDIQAYNWQKY